MKEHAHRNPLMAILLACAMSLCCFSSAWADEGSYLIEYKGEAAGLVSVEGDLFAHFPALLPGDVVDGEVTVLNSGDITQEVFFYTQPTGSSGNEKADELLYLLNLKIASVGTGEVLYNGVIHADEMNDPVSLGVFSQGEGDTLRFEVSVPASMGEEYASLGNQVHWVFAVPDGLSDGKNVYAIGQTGDAMGNVVPLLLLVVTMSASLLIVVSKRGSDEKERG